jgi:hypothetical protein
MDPAENLYNHGNPKMRLALTTIVNEMADVFKKIGFPVQAEAARQSWDDKTARVG